jgi:hypothetical protein
VTGAKPTNAMSALCCVPSMELGEVDRGPSRHLCPSFTRFAIGPDDGPPLQICTENALIMRVPRDRLGCRGSERDGAVVPAETLRCADRSAI